MNGRATVEARVVWMPITAVSCFLPASCTMRSAHVAASQNRCCFSYCARVNMGMQGLPCDNAFCANQQR